MERHAHQVLGGAAGGQQQGRGLVGLHAELAAKRIKGRAVGGCGQAHDQVQILGVAGGVENLGQFFVGVQGEGPHAVVEIGRGNSLPALDRVHEGQPRARRMFSHELDLGDRRHVEGPDALFGQGPDRPPRGVGLHGVKDVAFEVVLEPARRYGQNARPHKGDRPIGGPLADQVQGIMVRAQFT